MAKACVDLGIIEKVEDFDDETFTHSAILFEKLWEKIGDRHYKTPLELFEAWGKSEQKERHDKAMFIGAKIFGRKDGKLHKTKEGRKFIKMYDPETGECLGPLVKFMTHEEAHGKKEPVSDIKVNFNKEAWDKLKYEYDTDQPHF